jgi:hypothetical protein
LNLLAFMKFRFVRTFAICCPVFVPGIFTVLCAGDDLGPIQNLEAFVVRESAAYAGGTLDPSSRPLRGIFAGDRDALSVPRSLTQLSPEHFELLQVDDLRSLSRFGAGTQLINHYGVTGAPILRGAKGTALFNGMARAFNLNEMPLSFGSCESVDILKGPTPAHLSPTHVGGVVNLVPKSPYFDRSRGKVSLSVGSHDHYRSQLDYGGPMLIGDKPSAYRVSVTLNREGSDYDRLRNDYESLYFSMKHELSQGRMLFGGFEYFHYKSSENAGWNRPTQELIDQGQYVIGEPVNVVDAAYGQTANRDLVSFPLGYGWANGIEDFNALVVPRAVVEQALAEGRVSASAVDAMLNLSDPDDRARAYGQALPSTGQADPAFQARASVREVLAGLMQGSGDGYRYTRAYFDQGGTVFTTPIQGNQVLSDDRDVSEAHNLLAFANLEWSGAAGLEWANRFLSDALKTRKLSTYGYAIDTQQWVLADNLEASRRFDGRFPSLLSAGLGLRYTFSEMVQDYFAEPFSRRDISRREVSDNSRVLAGPQRGPDGLNYWSADIGANVRSHLVQGALFGQWELELAERWRLLLSGRAEQAAYSTAMPKRVDRVDDALREELDRQGDQFLYSTGVYLTYAMRPDLRLYVAAQEGTALDLTQAGGVYGAENFADADLLEAGVKGEFWGGRLQTTLSVWEWAQSRFNERDFQSEPLEGKGIEFEATATLLRDRLFLMASAENQRIRRKTGLGFRSLPQDAQGWALGAGVLNGGVDAYPVNNPELNYPGIPDSTYKMHLVWKSGALQASLGGVYSRSTWLNFEQTLRLPSAWVMQAYLAYGLGAWQASLAVENLGDEEHFLGSDPLFASNTLVTKGEPRRYTFKIERSF